MRLYLPIEYGIKRTNVAVSFVVALVNNQRQ
jgi:hypothetical protein